MRIVYFINRSAIHAPIAHKNSPPITDIKTYKAAWNISPFFIINNGCSENAENVVNPPNSPVIKKRLFSVVSESVNKTHRMPIIKHPARFISIVL